jgi:hypothetical protein
MPVHIIPSVAEFITAQERNNMPLSKKRYLTTKDGEVVLDGDPRGIRLLAAEGSPIPPDVEARIQEAEERWAQSPALDISEVEDNAGADTADKGKKKAAKTE